MYVKKDIDRLNKIYKFNKKINEKKKKEIIWNMQYGKI